MTLLLLSEKRADSTPQATVLMPLYDSATMVAESIASVLTQSGCVLDVIISDDCSEDDTLEVALAATRDYSGPHAVRFYSSSERLGIDHLQHLVDQAACRFLIEAHGDDVSPPGRMARLLDIHHETDAALIVSLVNFRHGLVADRIPEAPRPDAATGWLTLEQCVPPQGNGLLVGARYAFDKVIHDQFPRLDSRLAPSSHDRIQAFRACLLGRLWFTEERLLEYRKHPQQGSKAMVDSQNASTTTFGWSLRHLSALRAMRQDASHARLHELIPDDTYASVIELLAARSEQFLHQLLDSRDALVRTRQEVLWVAQQALFRTNVTRRR